MKKVSLMKSKKFVIYVKRNFVLTKVIKIHLNYTIKLEIIVITMENLAELLIIFATPKEIPVVAQNATYDYHFLIKQLAKEFEGQFECLGENSEKYITFSVPIKKEVDNVKTITYKLNFIDSFRFMADKLSNLAANLSEIYKKECNACMERKSQNMILSDLKTIN